MSAKPKSYKRHHGGRSRFPHHLPTGGPSFFTDDLRDVPHSPTLTMFFSTAAVVCALSLLFSTRALALVGGQSDCGFICPEVDVDGNGLLSFAEVGNASFSCTFSGGLESPCAYDSVSITPLIRWGLPTSLLQSTGALVGNDSGSRCPQQATSQCPTGRPQDNDGDASAGVPQRRANDHTFPKPDYLHSGPNTHEHVYTTCCHRPRGTVVPRGVF